MAGFFKIVLLCQQVLSPQRIWKPSEIKLLFSQHEKGFGSKKWLKTTEVLELLKISPGTLQNFRTNGTLPFSKIGGIIYYDAQDIQQILTDNKIHHNF